MQATQPLLSANFSVDYPQHSGVLRDVAFTIARGEIVGLVGQSGSGKSTLALALLQLLRLKGATLRGSIHFDGSLLTEKSERELRAIRGKRISLVLQSPLTSLNPALKIGTQLAEAWKAHRSGSRQECVAAMIAALESVSLPNARDILRRRPAEISVGQAQRVLIAMATLHHPALLIADEPTSALDVITQSEILQLFARLNREQSISILYISHDLLSVAALCHRIAILHEGQIVECAAAREIFQSPQHPFTQRLIAALPANPFAGHSAATPAPYPVTLSTPSSAAVAEPTAPMPSLALK